MNKTNNTLDTLLTELSFNPEQPTTEMQDSINVDKATPMTYNMNNGTLAYADEAGDVYVMPSSLKGERKHELLGRNFENDKAMQNVPTYLESNGYTHGEIFVPRSNDAGKWVTEKVKESKFHARQDLRNWMQGIYDNIETRLRDQGEQVEIRGAPELPEDVKANSKPAWSGYDDFAYNAEAVGTFTANNGVLAVYDNLGVPNVMENSEEAQQSLLEAGFTAGHVRVPHSNDFGEWAEYNL